MLEARYDDERVVLKGYALVNDRQRRNLERELRILSRVRHDAVIRAAAVVDDADSTSPVPMLYIEFPFCAGGNLRDWVATAPRAPWELRDAFRQALCGAMHLHDRGIVHKDIKPGNILVHADGRVMLADFDISRDIVPPRPIRAGTAGFMAPEVEAGQAGSPASDMFSLGAVLFWMHFPTHPTGPVVSAVGVPETADAALAALLGRLL
ncbi:unnamed protein product, partial [Phaeothamnion confervicola]